MNFRLVCKFLSIVSLLIGITMTFSLPWAFPALGHRTSEAAVGFETAGFQSLVISIGLCFICWAGLSYYARTAKGELFRKEAMAVVGLSWVLATILGGLPFVMSGTARSLSVRLFEGPDHPPQVFNENVEPITSLQYRLVTILIDAHAVGVSKQQLVAADEGDKLIDAFNELKALPEWADALIAPEEEPAPGDRFDHYRIRPIKMNLADALFESQSGFSTTGATVIADLEDPVLVPHCILFWRSSTHLLGGLGIIVLFVVVLGQGSAGKALMHNEMPGPSKEGAHSRMQQTAWYFTAIYLALNAVLTVILWLLGMTVFDALCHAFGTMATGGFSTYNDSLGHFYEADPYTGFWIEYVVIVFMVLAGMNFMLLYFLVVKRRLIALWKDVEWRTYMAVLGIATALVIAFGMSYGDFRSHPEQSIWGEASDALRYGLFQVVSIMTTTGYGTHDFDGWNSFGRGVLFLLMFVGGCAGSTGGGLKVIRHILFHKILYLQIEKAYHPSVIRPLRLGGKPVDDPDLQQNILVYFGLILVLFVFSWMAIITLEPDATWGTSQVHIEHKLIDSATSVAATLNNIGPGLGVIGAKQNYSNFTWWTKLLFVWLMMLGRLEIFAVAVLFIPSFWRSR